MNENHSNIEVDHLALGLTKSPTCMGVNIKMFFSNLIFCFLVCIDAHTFLGVPLFIFIHVLMVKISNKEPNFFYLYVKSFTKTPPILNHWFWGKTNSYEPW
jgi:type IV secretory pathway VirB3-like protein